MIVISFIFLIGIIFGSFLNVVIHRIPIGENIAFPASKCPTCQTPLKAYHNIPVFSWLFLKGKCAFCKEKISARYPIIELIGGLLAVLLYFKLGLVWYLPFVFLSFLSLLALSMIDFDYMGVPDSVNYAALAFALIQPDFLHAGMYALATAGVLYGLGFIASKLAGKEAMGMGDVIVAGTMGALLGFPNVLLAIFLSAILIMIPSLLTRGKEYPFVPFLSMATLILYIYDTQIVELIKGFYGIQ